MFRTSKKPLFPNLSKEIPLPFAYSFERISGCKKRVKISLFKLGYYLFRKNINKLFLIKLWLTKSGFCLAKENYSTNKEA